MTVEVVDLRRAARFVAVEPLAGTFASCDVTVLDLGLYGMQLSHGEPLRIGTRGRIVLRRDDIFIDTPARVVWSHLDNSGGKFVYTSGVHIDAPEPRYAAALNALFKSGAVRRDSESLERKRQRMLEREQQLAAKAARRNIPSSGPIT